MEFKYDSFYDKLFENEEFVELLYKFHSSVWKTLDEKARFDLLTEVVKKYAEILKIGDIKLKKIKDKTASGVYIDIGAIVNVNSEAINSTSQYDVLDTLFHELRHNFQHRTISKNLSSVESATKEQIKAWKLNFLHSPRGYYNYISNMGENSALYHYQPVEKDAFMTGLALTKKSFEIIKAKMGDDVEFKRYAQMNKSRIMAYFSDEKEWVEDMKLKENMVLELFERNNEELHIEKKCLAIAEETMKKEIKDMSMEELLSLFSVYVWAYLDDDYKIDLLTEYDNRVNKYKKVKIEKSGNSVIKVNGRISDKENITNILNDIFSYQFAEIVDMMIKGKEPCDPKLKEELTINMYKHDKKGINYIKDSDNFLLYSIQPYAVLEGKVIIEWFKKVKEVESKVYGVDNGDWDRMIDFYDYEKYIPYIEKFYGKSFDKIYNELVEQMKKKVSSVRKG